MKAKALGISGWPINLSTLALYYERAKANAKFEKPWLGDDEVPAALGIKLPKFATPGLRPYVWRYAPQGFRRFTIGPRCTAIDLRPIPTLWFCCICSVFPTGSQAKPTLTIVALAIRLADHLRSSVAR
jgi:hypothetical protein